MNAGNASHVALLIHTLIVFELIFNNMDSHIIYIVLSILLGYALGKFSNRWRVVRAEKIARSARASEKAAVEWRHQYERGDFAEEVLVIDPTDPEVAQHFYKMDEGMSDAEEDWLTENWAERGET